jgi:hypothetical protein
VARSAAKQTGHPPPQGVYTVTITERIERKEEQKVVPLRVPRWIQWTREHRDDPNASKALHTYDLGAFVPDGSERGA